MTFRLWRAQRPPQPSRLQPSTRGPHARLANLELNAAANRILIRHLEEGGVTTLMYGGNANFYNVGLYEYAAILDFLEQAVAKDSWVVPSAGPDFGKLLDQAHE